MSKEKKNRATRKPGSAASQSPGNRGGRYFFGALKKIALFPFAAGSSKALGQEGSPENWDQIDPFHHRPDLAFT